MATAKQKSAARKNIKKAQSARKTSTRGTKKSTARSTEESNGNQSGMSTAKKNVLPASTFAFPDERKEPLTDARHVRNAIARFDQVEGVSDAERERAWKRIKSAAKKYDVEVTASSWRELFEGGKAKKK